MLMITYRVRQQRMFRYEAFHFLSDNGGAEIGRVVKRFLLNTNRE